MGKINKSTTSTNLRDLQLKSLEILLYFKEFCIEHDLTFYLCGGACIGTVRHQGFIPWDDDIDVFMPRKDYRRLGDLWNKYADTERYSYCITNRDINLKHSIATIRDNNTCFIRDYQADLDINHGVRLEIIPLDGCPESKIKRQIQIGWAFVFHLFNREANSVGFSKIIEKVSSCILSIIKSRRTRYKIWRYAEKKMSQYPINEDTKYITELCVPYRYMKNKYPAEIFKEQHWLMFEGHMMPIPIGYDKYLSMAFGDYMKLPPEDERIPKHDTVFIDLKNSYKKYKGKYYCVDKRNI